MFEDRFIFANATYVLVRNIKERLLLLLIKWSCWKLYFTGLRKGQRRGHRKDGRVKFSRCHEG